MKSYQVKMTIVKMCKGTTKSIEAEPFIERDVGIVNLYVVQ